jgi:hypothetical protein
LGRGEYVLQGGGVKKKGDRKSYYGRKGRKNVPLPFWNGNTFSFTVSYRILARKKKEESLY